MVDVSNYADVIDSRDVIARIEELEAEEELDQDEADELAALTAFAEDARNAADWEYGETFVRDSYFEDYVRELAEDLHGDELGKATWPFTCIDWERAARELRMDYTAYSYGDITYWAR